MYSGREQVSRALKLTVATLVVAIIQACWHVFAFLMPSDEVRPDDWWLHSLLKTSALLLAFGIVPLSIAFLISVSGPNTLMRQSTAVMVSNIVGSAGYFAIVWGSLFLVGPLFVVGVAAYALALLPIRGAVTGLRRRLHQKHLSAG